jgi:serine/threonine protein kinase/dipeptidyl aminopeptidase/acylaminoacyl peptidase
MLVQSCGEVITREQLHQKLWPNGTIVEFDNSINAAIRRLREALEDSADTPRYIETLPRRGYRFLVPVEHTPATETVSSVEPEPSSDGLEGQTISRYRVGRKLGHGAMGVVYQAEDIRLGRSVAIKFLPEELSDDPRALDRFEREARAASALNHPNICTVYEVDEHKGARFIAMEYVLGKSLDQLISPGGLPVQDLLNYAAQIADALAMAHSAGIVHRDLKPSNIMVSQEGLVKLLDFGLAKMSVTQPAVDVAAQPADAPLTVEGTILGTLQYMAPEQLEGREADARTDIFAFGAVTYEMATGRKAFEGKSQASLIAAILEREPPPISTVRALGAVALDRVVATCVAKKPDDRWQSARDLLRELQWLKEGRMPRRVTPTGFRTWLTLPWMLLAAVSLALVVLAVIHFRSRPTEPNVVRFQVPLPPSGTPWEDIPAVSPDGRFVAFSQFTPDDKLGLWIHSLDSMTTRLMPGTEGAFAPFWSADNRFVAFFERESSRVDDHLHSYLKKVDVTTGAVQTICETQYSLGEGSWNQDGVILFSQAKPSAADGRQTRALYRVPGDGGEVRPVLELDKSRQERSQTEPQFLPDGRHFLYRSMAGSEEAEKEAIYVGSLNSKETSRLASVDSNVTFAPPGFLLFGREGTLLAQPFDLQKLRLIGESVPVAAEHVARWRRPPASSLFSASQNAVLVYLNETSPNIQLAWYKRDGARLGSIGEPGPNEGMRISPDETQLVLDRTDPQTGQNDVWTLQLSSGIFTRVTFGPGNNIGPEWSPDGHELAFSSDRRASGLYDVYRKPVGGGNDELLLASEDQSRTPQQWFRDGSILLNSWGGRVVGGHNLFYRLPLSGTHAGLRNTTGQQNTFIGAIGAGQSNTTGSFDVYINNSGPPSEIESHTIRIGDPEFQASAYIAGIYGSFVGGNGVAVYVDSDGQLGTVVSSRRFKEQIRDMGDTSSALMKLRPVTFLYKPEYDKGPRTLQYGLIAEEVAEVYPDLVAYDPDGKPYTVKYQYLTTMLLNEVQKQYRRAEAEAAEVIRSQEQKIEELEQRLSRLEKLVTNQETVIAQK